MQQLSILLGLSGSEQSKFAAEVAWSIARRCNGKVCAQHVIDTRTVWELLRNDKPGFIGSGLYVAAYESMSQSLHAIADKLTAKFEAISAGKNVPTETVVDEGSPVTAITNRAKRHDLVIIGHQPRYEQVKDHDHSNFVRYAVAEGLAHDCSRALLVVQSEVEEWKTMSILLSVDHVNFNFFNACLKLASLLGLKPEVIALASGTHEEKPEAFMKDLKQAAPMLEDIPVRVVEFKGISADDKYSLWHPESMQLDWHPEPDTLMVIPTRRIGDKRLTVFDTSPDLFVRNLTVPSILMWPEEHTELTFDSAESGKELAKG